MFPSSIVFIRVRLSVLNRRSVIASDDPAWHVDFKYAYEKIWAAILMVPLDRL